MIRSTDTKESCKTQKKTFNNQLVLNHSSLSSSFLICSIPHVPQNLPKPAWRPPIPWVNSLPIWRRWEVWDVGWNLDSVNLGGILVKHHERRNIHLSIFVYSNGFHFNVNFPSSMASPCFWHPAVHCQPPISTSAKGCAHKLSTVWRIPPGGGNVGRQSPYENVSDTPFQRHFEWRNHRYIFTIPTIPICFDKETYLYII